MSEFWLSLVITRASNPCGEECAACTAYGLTRPSVELRRTSRAPRRWLHGHELEKFYRLEDEAAVKRNAVFARLKSDLLPIGGRVLRGSEVEPRPAPAGEAPSES